jgi:hypothetical protein
MASIPIKNSNMTQCGLSGFMVNFDDTVLLWNGVRVWKKFYEKRNEQDFIPAFDDVQAPRDGTVSENNSNAVDVQNPFLDLINGFGFQDVLNFISGESFGLIG